MNKVTRIKNANYTTISNVFLRDKELSLKAKGLLATILSLPEDWDFSIKGICATIKEGTTAVYSAIDELKERGYCKVVTNRNEKGMIVGNDYTFYEDPSMENLNVGNQTQINTNISLPNTKNTNNKEKNKEEEETNKELFEQCWIAYRRKGKKGKSLLYWKKLTESDKQMVLPHIKAYVTSRELQYQQDFERYLRDKTFTTIVFLKNKVIYDPTRLDKKDKANEVYMPLTDGALSWNDYYTCYMYVGYWDGKHIPDGYDDDTRPDGASVTLNNGRGTITWDSKTKTWNKI
jgi:hypothetical protein|nr:MAG TPA: Dna polymerase B [Caudoviricetes sp.]